MHVHLEEHPKKVVLWSECPIYLYWSKTALGNELVRSAQHFFAIENSASMGEMEPSLVPGNCTEYVGQEGIIPTHWGSPVLAIQQVTIRTGRGYIIVLPKVISNMINIKKWPRSPGYFLLY